MNANSPDRSIKDKSASIRKPLVSIVIPHRGSDVGLDLCINAIRKQTYPRESIETLIVLNEPALRNLNFNLLEDEVLIWQPIEGSYAARNLGIERCSGEIVAFTDSDTQPSPNWISEGLNCLSGSAQLAAGAIEVTHSNPPSASALFEKLYAFDQEKNVLFGHSVTANLMVKADVFKTYGLFDYNAKSGEDFEWTESVTSRGAVLVYCDKAKVAHPARENWRDLTKKAFRTTWHFPKGPSGGATFIRIMKRVRQQLLHGPSPSKRRNMPALQRLIAHSVRIALISFKGVLLSVKAIRGAAVATSQFLPTRGKLGDRK